MSIYYGEAVSAVNVANASMNKFGYILLLSLLTGGDVCLKTEKIFADVRVCIVDSRRLADLRVYITDSHFEGNGNDAIWRFTSGGFNTITIAFTTRAHDADIAVFFVSSAWESGWARRILNNKRHKLKGAFE